MVNNTFTGAVVTLLLQYHASVNVLEDRIGFDLDCRWRAWTSTCRDAPTKKSSSSSSLTSPATPYSSQTHHSPPSGSPLSLPPQLLGQAIFLLFLANFSSNSLLLHKRSSSSSSPTSRAIPYSSRTHRSSSSCSPLSSRLERVRADDALQ